MVLHEGACLLKCPEGFEDISGQGKCTKSEVKANKDLKVESTYFLKATKTFHIKFTDKISLSAPENFEHQISSKGKKTKFEPKSLVLKDKDTILVELKDEQNDFEEATYSLEDPKKTTIKTESGNFQTYPIEIIFSYYSSIINTLAEATGDSIPYTYNSIVAVSMIASFN